MRQRLRNPQAPRYVAKPKKPLPVRDPSQGMSAAERIQEREEARRFVYGSTSKEKTNA